MATQSSMTKPLDLPLAEACRSRARILRLRTSSTQTRTFKLVTWAGKTSYTFACLLALFVHTRESLCPVAWSKDIYSGHRGFHSLSGVNECSVDY